MTRAKISHCDLRVRAEIYFAKLHYRPPRTKHQFMTLRKSFGKSFPLHSFFVMQNFSLCFAFKIKLCSFLSISTITFGFYILVHQIIFNIRLGLHAELFFRVSFHETKVFACSRHRRSKSGFSRENDIKWFKRKP